MSSAPNTQKQESSSFGWFMVPLAGVVAFLVLAGVRFHWLRLGDETQTPLRAPPLPVAVRFVLAAPLQAGQQAAAPAYIAEVRGDNELNLSFEVGGVLDLIGPEPGKNWVDGTVVKAGTLLARLRPDEFVHRVKAAQARADLARLMAERFQNLAKSQSVPQEKADQAAAEKKTADADLAAAQQALKESELRAPYDATILARHLSPTEVVSSGRPVLRLANLRRMSVEVGVPDTALSQVHNGQEVPVIFSALPGRSFTGRVAEVGVAGEEGSRLFKVKIKVDNADGLIKSGMTASVSFKPAGKESTGSVWVPLAALMAEADGPLSVFVIDDDNHARRQPIQTDEIAGNLIMVTRGLHAGEKVVVTGVGTLYDGALVNAVPAQAGFY